jgi:hypothetical protein
LATEECAAEIFRIIVCCCYPGIMSFDVNQIISYRDMCNAEDQEQLQRGMNYNIGDNYSIVLMSVKPNAPYADRISDDGLTIYYEGHDIPGDKLKEYDQSGINPGGSYTQNGLFSLAIDNAKIARNYPLVKVYEKLKMGIWTYRGLFEMRNYSIIERNQRKVYEFVFTITEQKIEEAVKHHKDKIIDLEQTRQIPGKVKITVYKRDKGVCVQCGASDNIHFDHILPYSKGGTSLKVDNIQLLCARHNLQKSAKINF